jgi:hypothetical protein
MDMTASEIKSYYFAYSKAMHESYNPSIVSSQSSMTLATAIKSCVITIDHDVQQ